MIAGIVLGLLFESVHAHRFFLMKGSLLHPLYLGIKMIADCTIPCALLILGGKLAVRRPPGFIQKRAVYMTVFLRLLVIPSAVLAVVTLLWRLDFLPQDPFIPLMIVLIAAMPPSNDLVVIASANHKTEGLIANLTFWCYLCSILTIPVFISLAMRIFSS